MIVFREKISRDSKIFNYSLTEVNFYWKLEKKKIRG